ncbi:MAG: DinB family protein [Gemmatimonadales bacterium]
MNMLDQQAAVRDATLPHFDLPADRLDRTYGPGKWSVRFLLHHLADSESVFYYRLRRVISEPKQVIWVYDQDLWAAALDYPTMPIDLSKRLYQTSREGIIRLADRHYAGSGDIWFVHSETGRRTLRDEFDKVVWHNQGHLDQIAAALA